MVVDPGTSGTTILRYGELGVGKARAVSELKVLGKFCHFWHWSKAGPALEGGDEMSLFSVEMSLSMLILSLAMSLVRVEMSLSLML